MLALKESSLRARPAIVLAHADPLYASLVRQIFLRLEWDVYLTSSGAGARELAAEMAPALVVLDIDLPDESGWLTCAKLIHEQPNLSVVLVTSRITRSSRAFAEYVGAGAIVGRNDGLRALVDAARDVALAAAG
jgi:DNA-binding response OmpR family regulator